MCDIYYDTIFCSIHRNINICTSLFIAADEEPEKKELLGVNTGIMTKPAKLNPFVKIFSFFHKELHIKLYQACKMAFACTFRIRH